MIIKGSVETIHELRITGAQLRELLGAPEGASVVAESRAEHFYLGDEGAVTVAWKTIEDESAAVHVKEPA